MIIIKTLLMLFLFLINLNAACSTRESVRRESVDEQTDAWKRIWSTARSHSDFSWEKTHVPGLKTRVDYMAHYVWDAVRGNAEREGVINFVLVRAQTDDGSSSLTLQQAFRYFDILAETCDKTLPVISLDTLSGELPESYFEKTAAGYTYSSHFRFSDMYFLCVRKGGLKIERFVEGYLNEKPYHLVALPCESPSVHGGTIDTVKDFYDHEIDHVRTFIISQGTCDEWFQDFWPGYRKIKTVRDSLSQGSRQRKIVDTFLFEYFHEMRGNLVQAYFANNMSFWMQRSCPDHESEAIYQCSMQAFQQAVTADIEAFLPFIDKIKNLISFEIPIYLISRDFYNKAFQAVRNEIAADINVTKKDDQAAYVSFSNAFFINFDDYRSKLVGNQLTFEDELEWRTGLDVLHSVPCTVTLDDIRKEKTQVTLVANGRDYIFETFGPQFNVAFTYQDILGLVKEAGYNVSAVGDHATIDNYHDISGLYNQLLCDAAQILKNQYKLM